MRRSKRSGKDRLRRGIYILPNIFTSLNIFFGFYAIIASVNGKFVSAAYAIYIAAVFDLLDGKIARATNTTSRFGVEYDSLADLVSFGLAPGLMMYLWALQPMGRFGWLAAFLFMVCGALRLARFNTQVGTVSSKYFVGLPIPAAAGMTAATLLLWHRLGLEAEGQRLLMLLMLYALAFLMVSSIKYPSMKNVEMFRSRNFNVLVAAILVLIFVAAQPSITLFSVGLMYVVSGPVVTIWRMRKAKTVKTEPREVNKPRQLP